MGISIPLRALQSVKPRGALQTLSRLTISAFVIAPYLGLNVSSAFAEEANAGQDSQERGAVVDSSAPTSPPHESCRWFLDPKTFHEPQPGCQPASGGKHAGGAQRTEEAARPKPALNVPASLNTISGLVSSGVLQKSLGLPADAPLQIGGIASFIGNRLTSGGLKPNTSSGERVFGFNAALDMERLFPFAPIPGGELFSSMIQYEGGKASQYAGSIQGYDSVNAWSEKYGRHRLELYEVYWRQRLLDNRLIIKVGKIMGAAEFAQPNYPPTIPQDPSRMAWTISDLFFVPVGYLPIFQGKLPTYANTAWGAIVTVQPTPAIYAKYGFFDGNSIRYETGPRIGPNLNENTFQIAEASLSWELGEERKAGRISGGFWKQSGLMAAGMLDPIKGGVLLEHGARGFFAVANQRLWYLNDTDPRGLVGWANFGYSPSQTSAVQHYLGGGVTALGLVPIRPQDTISFGFAWSRLNQGAIAGTVFASPLPAPWGWPISPYASQTRLNSTERMYQITYRFVLIPGKIVFDAGYTAIPNPGYRPNIPWANAVTLRSFVVF
jgi:carbohydrate-selective porin OprB